MGVTLDKIDKANARAVAREEPKTGLGVVREAVVRAEGAAPEARVIVWDYDANRVLWSGGEADYARLARALHEAEG